MGSVKGEMKSANFVKCKLIANFSATMVTSLPSLSLYLSLSPSAPHAQNRKRFCASYNNKRFRASYIVREVRSVRERERDTERERERERQTEVTSSLPR